MSAPDTLAGISGRAPKLAKTPSISLRERATAAPIDWRAVAEIAGPEAAQSLLSPVVTVFTTRPTLKQLLVLQREGNSLPEGYTRQVVSLVEKTQELTRRDYATYAAYDRAVAKGNNIKRWWEATTAVVLDAWYKPNQLFREVVASSSTNAPSPSPLSTR